MEPSIRFCTSADGTQLAYATLGDGAPFVHIPGFSTNMEIEWNDPESRAWMERVASRFMLVRTEHRGVGASQREVNDISLKAQVDDLTAVVDHAGLSQVTILAAYDGVANALAFAKTHPDRVFRLALWGGFARGADVNTPQSLDALTNLARGNWRLFLRTWADLCFPTGPPERQRWYAELVRRSVSPETTAAYIEFMRDVDVTETAKELRTPALVVHREGDRYVPVAAGRMLARLLPNATFVPLKGDIGWPPIGDSSYLERVFAFFDGDRASSQPPAPSGTVVILFTDIADSTMLTERMGDAAFRAASRTLDERLRSIIRDTGGSAIEGKLLGDGVMAVFGAASQAIDAARRCVEASAATGLRLHVGLHAGDVIREAGNVYGGAVNIAARVCALSGPDEILVSATVRDLARTSAGVRFEDGGEHSLKGIDDAVRVFAVRERP